MALGEDMTVLVARREMILRFENNITASSIFSFVLFVTIVKANELSRHVYLNFAEAR